MVHSDQWRRLSPYLDEALEMTDGERAAWLRELRRCEPDIAGLLEDLMREHCAHLDDGFLERPVLDPAGAAMLAGEVLGGYRLLSPIGRGGMSNVWLAERTDGRFERQVAVKFLNIALAGSEGERRFRREGEILGLLTHSHIAGLLDAGISSTGQPYLVLEYVDGDHIDCFCDQHRLNLRARIQLFLDVLAAVAQAHTNLIVHRDLKPSNVLVGSDGQVKLLDFGIAKLLESEDPASQWTQLTAVGASALTPRYAAPEQLRGGQITTATDIYALGCLLYVLLTGHHPSGAGAQAPADLIKSIIDTEPARPSDAVVSTQNAEESATANATARNATPDKLRRTLRGDLDTIVLKALKKDPTERYASVNALADDLQRYLDNKTISARPEAWTYRVVKFVRRHRVPVALATLAWLAIVVGTVSTLIQVHTARMERDFAQRQVGRTAALNEFHRFLLSDAAPSGKPLTTGELLGRAEQIVAQQHTLNDPTRVELMVSIGRQYLEQDDARNARRILEEAYRVSRGISDPSIRSSAACAQAAGLARDEEVARAESLFQEGIRELPEGSQYALERMGCLQDGAEVALQNNAVREGLTRAQEAQRILQHSPFDSDVMEMHAWMDLAKAYSAAGRDAEAISSFERASTLISFLGRDHTATAAVMFNDWAIELQQIGHPRDAERIYRRAIDIMSVGQAEDEVSPIILNNYARSLRELGRLSEAEHYAEHAYANAERVSHQLAINQCLLERARIYTEQHNASRAAVMLASVEPRLRHSLPAGHYAFAALASAQAFNALEKGDKAEALQLADRAVSIDEEAIKAGADGAYLLPILLTHRSEIELAAEMPEKALVDANRALDQLKSTTQAGMFSSNTGHAYLAQGRALLLAGKHDEAKAAFRSAFEQFQQTLGPDHPETASARHQATS